MQKFVNPIIKGKDKDNALIPEKEERPSTIQFFVASSGVIEILAEYIP